MITENHPASWKRIWRENRLYLIAFLSLFLLGLGVYLSISQGDDILFFNRRRTAFGDFFFRYGTLMGEEIAYIFVGLILLFYSYRHLIMVPIIGIVVTIVTTLMKNFFGHPRPLKWFQINGLDNFLHTAIDGVFINMGFNSFPSGHTMSAFALYTFLALCVPRKGLNSLILLSLPLMVAISRIYLIQHFLEDVLLGALVGVILGVTLYRMQYLRFMFPHPWLDNGLSLWPRSKVEQAIEQLHPQETGSKI